MERDATRFGVRIRRPHNADESVEDLAAMVAPLIAHNPSQLADRLDEGLVAVKRLAFDEAAEAVSETDVSDEGPLGLA